MAFDGKFHGEMGKQKNVRIVFVGKCPTKIELLENVLDNLARLSSYGIALG